MSPVCLDRRARFEPYLLETQRLAIASGFRPTESPTPQRLTLRRGLSFYRSRAYASYLRGPHDQCSAG
jgi:hypothetical protein